jgi:hypothetical protein
MDKQNPFLLKKKRSNESSLLMLLNKIRPEIKIKVA